jgi:hypothetical protein
MPVVWPLVPNVHESVKAAGELLGNVGGAYISVFFTAQIARLRGEAKPRSKLDVEKQLREKLEQKLDQHDLRSAGLRADAAILLKRINAIEAALTAAPSTLRPAIAANFKSYNEGFIQPADPPP